MLPSNFLKFAHPEKFDRFVVAFLFLALAGCGGGGGGEAVIVPPSYPVWIVSPSDNGTYQTDATSVSLKGGAFVPEGASCNGIVGTMPSGYQVVWSNGATGSHGVASFYLGCLLQVNVIWEAPLGVSLALGSNSITVTASDSAGHVGHDTIVITRVSDTTPPRVISTTPIAGANNVPINTVLRVVFSEAMAPASINSTTITLSDNLNNPILASVSSCSGCESATVTPFNPLSFSTTYRTTVTTGVSDAAGNALAAPYVFTFTTGANPDNTPPSVESVSPTGSSTCAPTSGAVTATFNEDLNPATVNGSTFSLAGPGGSSVSGTVAYLNRTASFTPDADLAPTTSYTAALTTDIADLAGNLLASLYQWSFTTVPAHGPGAWAPTSVSAVPYARSEHVAVWTGSEMIVAGGLAWNSDFGSLDYTSQYGRYNPLTDTWTVATGALAGIDQKAVWTGSRMLVWGGYESGFAVTRGARYDPVDDSWTAITAANAPSARHEHTAVWTGSEMIVWGGHGAAIYGDGARYNPVSDTWQAVSTIGAPSARYGHTAVWTGTEMIVWGGVSATGTILADGARYNPATNTWAPMSNTTAPSARSGHVAVWTGAKMMVWGNWYGGTNTGGLYDPVTDSWIATDPLCAPAGRWRAPAVWTGTRMVIWGGVAVSSYFADGYEFDPAMNMWQKITATGAPTARAGHTAVWADTRVIVWGGADGGPLFTGGLFTP